MIKTIHEIYKYFFGANNFTKKVGILFYQVFHQSPKVVDFYKPYAFKAQYLLKGY